MTNITESATFTAGIYQIETTDPVVGGADGISNAQAKALANRTQYLKAAVEHIIDGTTPVKLNGAADSTVENEFTPGQADKKIATTAFVQASIALAMGKNAIINGGMDVAQRGTSFHLDNNVPIFTLDRWLCHLATGTRTCSITQDKEIHRTSVPGAANCMKAVLSAAVGDLTIKQRMEGIHLFERQTVTVSFWLYLSTNQTFTIYLSQFINQDQVTNNSPVNHVSAVVNGTTGVHFYSVNLAVPSTTTVDPGNLDDANCLELAIKITGSNATTLWITNVQVEKGTIPSTFESLPLAMVRAMCSRFFEKMTIYERWDQPESGNFSHFFTESFCEKRIRPSVTAQDWTFSHTKSTVHTISHVQATSFNLELQAENSGGESVVAKEATATILVDAEIQ